MHVTTSVHLVFHVQTHILYLVVGITGEGRKENVHTWDTTHIQQIQVERTRGENKKEVVVEVEVEEREDGEAEETKKIRNERRQTEVKQINDETKKSKVIQAVGSKDAATNSIVVANVDKLIIVYSHRHVAADRIASAGISHQICVSAACTDESVSHRYEDFTSKS